MKFIAFTNLTEHGHWIAWTRIPIEGDICGTGETPEQAKSNLKTRIREFISKRESMVSEIDIDS